MRKKQRKRPRKLSVEKASAINRKRDLIEGHQVSFEHERSRVGPGRGVKVTNGHGLGPKLDTLAAEFILNVLLVARHALKGKGPLPAYRQLRKRVLYELDREYCQAAITAAWGNVSEAARIAKIDRKHLWRLMRRTGAKYAP